MSERSDIMNKNNTNNDFSKGSIAKNILNLSIPMTIAQFVNVLYNIVDRIYIGRLPNNSTLALTGIGLCLPIVTTIMAFASLFGAGGAPLCSISRGEGNKQKAETIMGNSFALLLVFGVLLTLIGLLTKEPILYLFGASSQTFSFANDYISLYLIGTPFVLISLGMNYFINAQGFGNIGMLTVIIGAISNIILDPILIFTLNMGVKGAALATVISQGISSFWVLKFLTSDKAILRLKFKYMRLVPNIVKNIVSLGFSGFIMHITNSGVQIVCNIKLSQFGGDLYVGVMTVLNSIREVIQLPAFGLTNGAQPILGYNYGAKEYERVKSSIKFITIITVSYMLITWIALMAIPGLFIRIFTPEIDLINATLPAQKIYFFGFFMMGLQFSAQSTFVSLGKAKHAIFFSLLRKVIIVIPLTLILPHISNLGIYGVFLAEPISNFIGGTAAYATMLATVWQELSKKRNTH